MAGHTASVTGETQMLFRGGFHIAHVILLTWDPANTASTSRFLKEEVCSHFDMNIAIAENEALLKTLTK